MTMRYAHLSPGYLAAASSKLDLIMPPMTPVASPDRGEARAQSAEAA
jgi:hypothetical protein